MLNSESDGEKKGSVYPSDLPQSCWRVQKHLLLYHPHFSDIGWALKSTGQGLGLCTVGVPVPAIMPGTKLLFNDQLLPASRNRASRFAIWIKIQAFWQPLHHIKSWKLRTFNVMKADSSILCVSAFLASICHLPSPCFPTTHSLPESVPFWKKGIVGKGVSLQPSEGICRLSLLHGWKMGGNPEITPNTWQPTGEMRWEKLKIKTNSHIFGLLHPYLKRRKRGKMGSKLKIRKYGIKQEIKKPKVGHSDNNQWLAFNAVLCSRHCASNFTQNF